MNSQQKKDLTELVERVKIAVSCCCSYHRYDEITKLCNEIEQVLDKDYDKDIAD